MARHAELSILSLPEFGLPTVEPQIPADLYLRRIERLRNRATDAGFDVFVVYGDREHFANLCYLTGYDPRFEESLFVMDLRAGASARPRLLVGNEGWGFAGISPIVEELELVLYQSFSLLDQPRSRSAPLSEILRSGGIGPGTRVGTAGWKHFVAGECARPGEWLEIPSYLVDTMRELTGRRELVSNANSLLMGSPDGLRLGNEAEQLARFEFVGTHSSQAVRNVLFGLRPGMTELEAATLMRLGGLPLSCHLMLSSGKRAYLGMGSPTMHRIEEGEPFTTACGLWGSLNSRAGFVVADAADLPPEIGDYVERLVAPYFEAIAAWYETVGIGVAGGELFRAVHDRIGGEFFGVGLNPGHFVHLDEWVSSPVWEGSTHTLRSGMALQVDVIPSTGSAYYTTNIEDGIALADDELRRTLRSAFPEAWSRIEARRAFMQDVLGIRLKPEVLPLSNIPAYLPPLLLSPRRAMRMVP